MWPLCAQNFYNGLMTLTGTSTCAFFKIFMTAGEILLQLVNVGSKQKLRGVF